MNKPVLFQIMCALIIRVVEKLVENSSEQVSQHLHNIAVDEQTYISVFVFYDKQKSKH